MFLYLRDDHVSASRPTVLPSSSSNSSSFPFLSFFTNLIPLASPLLGVYDVLAMMMLRLIE
ncbi:hypothetical protein K470DRAFT_133837 [Piedraia hortae CBS 480.64]|uniref:Uncharacterized protein n=1 Tax=Piedraia hortae CBS 480.64 TaxID=1314780 RepID=A0A6A7BT24_9PEZI|nr:hypothetical protein K470DRAFT_133837 [Piedraia hortae CBS 480.64]